MKIGYSILLIILFLILFLFITSRFYSFDRIDFQELVVLPYYAVSSFMRMAVAYFFALSFALSYGYIAATNERAKKIMLPALDILQSVPILGFFPAAVLFFIGIFQGRPGIEAAAIFLIFTSMAWNLAFGVYESLTTIPKELVEAADGFKLHGWQRLENLTLPACIPKLVYNSMVSWSAGWFFLVASEIISAGSETYKLPGLGSFLIDSTYSGKIPLMIVGLSVLIAIILLLELFIWRPMQSWADRYRYEYSGERKPKRFIFGAKTIKYLFRFAFEVFSRLIVSSYIALNRHGSIKTILKYSSYLILISFFIYALHYFIILISRMLMNLPDEAYLIPLAIVYSFLRLCAAYAIVIAWTVPAAVYIARNQKVSSFLMPLIEVAASIPAIALFPAIVIIFIRSDNLEIAAIILLLMGMQWYLLFNLIAGVKSVPKDMNNVAAAFRIRGRRYWKNILFPAMFPSFVTGSITAWGGGWNTLIVAEYIVYRGNEYHLFGIGYLIDRATFSSPDSSMVVLSIIGMAVIIMLLNRMIWQPLYRKAQTRYKFEV